MSEKLLPCPFCGERGSLRQAGAGIWWVVCEGCKTTTDDVGRDRAIDLWNARAPQSRASAPETFNPEADIAKMLQDPAVVHLNMLRGGIAKPSWANIKHLYPEQFAENANSTPTPSTASSDGPPEPLKSGDTLMGERMHYLAKHHCGDDGLRFLRKLWEAGFRLTDEPATPTPSDASSGEPVALTESERHNIEHMRYSFERANEGNPDCCFDFDLIGGVLKTIDRLLATPSPHPGAAQLREAGMVSAIVEERARQIHMREHSHFADESVESDKWAMYRIRQELNLLVGTLAALAAAPVADDAGHHIADVGKMVAGWQDITMSDVRLVAGEGNLAAHEVLAAVNGHMRLRLGLTDARNERGGPQS